MDNSGKAQWTRAPSPKGRALLALAALTLAGCTINGQLYRDRLGSLTDDDGDGYSEVGGDCNDSDPSSHPNATESCDGIDEDCNGLIDDSPPDHPWYMDFDGDGFGSDVEILSCEAVDGYVSESGDCDDYDSMRHPGAIEMCDTDSRDEDCDGFANEYDPEGAVGSATWFIDADDDGFGSTSYSVDACNQPTGYVDNSEDCDDLRSSVNPGREEVCQNSLDDNCDSSSNECRIVGEHMLDASEWKVYGGAGKVLGAGVALVPPQTSDSFGSIAMLTTTADGPSLNGLIIASADPDLASLDEVVATVTSTSTESMFFSRIVLSADTDQDGMLELALGCPECLDGEGVLLIFSLPMSGNLTTDSAVRSYTGGFEGAGFGFSLDASADLTGDEFPDLLVSGYGDDRGGANAGAVWLLPGSSTGLPANLGEPTWLGADPGDSLAAATGSEDLNGDGFLDLALGAPGRSATGSYRGAAYIIHGPDLERSLSDADGIIWGSSDAALVGLHVAMLSDATGDGLADLAVSTTGDRDCTEEAGGVALFGGPVEVFASIAEGDACLMGDERGDEAGSTLKEAGDVDGNGTSDIFVGAPQAGDGRGKAWLIYTPVRGSFRMSTLFPTFSGDVQGDQAGWSLDAGVDVNADGVPDMVVGAKPVYVDPDHMGAAYLILGLGL